MSTDRDVNRIVRSWLEEGVSALPDRVLDTVLDQLPATPQRRAWWPVRRFGEMNSFTKFAVAAAAVALVAFVGLRLLPGQGTIGSVPSPSASPASSPSTAPPSPTQSAAATSTASGVALPDGPLPAGTYVMVPCSAPPCPTSDDSIHLTIDVPSGWSGAAPAAVWIAENAAPGGAAVGVNFGGDLPRDPCLQTDLIDTGSTVDGFANAIAAHPVLDATDPVDVSLSGYSGKYIDLRLPADLSSCPEFRPWEPGIYAQGPNHQWHLWILDVAGTRVVVGSMDYPGTSAQHRAELQAMVDSIQIEP
jgi:hypothetical protein